MATDKDTAGSPAQSRLDFLLCWPIPIAIAVLGSKFGGLVGSCLIFPLAVVTGGIATLIVSKPKSVWWKTGGLVGLYLVAAVLTWLVLGRLMPAIRTMLEFG